MNRRTHRERPRPRALLLLALLLHLLGAAFAPAAHARFADGGGAPAAVFAPLEDAGAHHDPACAVCLALHSAALPAVAGAGAPAAGDPAARPGAAVQRPPSAADAAGLRARAPPLP
jgi:hypothetical protein